MKLGMALGLLATLTFGCVGFAQSKPRPVAKNAQVLYMCPRHAQVRATWAGHCPHCRQQLARSEHGAHGCGCPMCVMAHPAPTKGSAGKTGLHVHGPGCCAMRSKASSGDPDALVSLSTTLDLTDVQIQQLKSISEKARQDAAALLSAEQKAKLRVLTPETGASQEAPRGRHGHGGSNASRGKTQGWHCGCGWCR